MSITDIFSILVVKRIDPTFLALINLLWGLIAWFMTYYLPPLIAICIAYYFGKKTFIAEKHHDRVTLARSRQHEFIRKRYILEGFDKISVSLNWYLAHYNFNYSVAIEVVGRCKTQRTSNNDKLEDLNFKPVEILHDLSPFPIINNLLGDNIYFLIMQLVNARTETYYYSRCLDMLDLGKYILENREKEDYKNYNNDLKQLEELKESETDIFYRFHNLPFSILVISDAFENFLLTDEPLENFRNNRVVKEQIFSMEEIFKTELKEYENRRLRGDQLCYFPNNVQISMN